MPRYVQVSTDEVYGTLGPDDPPFTETTPLAPNSPYAASKAGADLLVRAAHHTHELETVITRCSNNYGPYQFPEKLIPLFITNALADIPLPVYGDGKQVRDWIHVRDHCRGISAALRTRPSGGSLQLRRPQRTLQHRRDTAVLQLTGKPESLIRTSPIGRAMTAATPWTAPRPRRSWAGRQTVTFEQGLAETVDWYRTHTDWVERVRSGAYRELSS